MDLQSVKELLENGDTLPSIEVLPGKFFNTLTIQGIQMDHIEPGHLLCSMKVPPRLVNGKNFLNGGGVSSLIDIIGAAAIAYAMGPVESPGVTLELNISYFDVAFLHEEIEIEAKVSRIGEAIGVVNVELRKKKTGKLIAHARQTAYLVASYSKL